MADTLDKFTRRVKSFYEEVSNRLMAGKIGVDQFLFNTSDIDADSSAFALDTLVVNPHGVSFRRRGEQSIVRAYEPGIGMIYEVPRSSEKTPITEVLRDAVIAGGESTEAFSSKEARMVNQILTQHTVGHTVTRWKLAIDVIRTGKFSPTGFGGADLGLEIDYGRDASLDMTYDFTAAGATINKALRALYDGYRAMGGNPENMCMILGAKWLQYFEEDNDVIEYMKANTSNVIVMRDMIPANLLNTQGLYLAARYRIPGTLTPVNICGFSPENQFVAYKGAAEADFFPEDEAVVFSSGATRYRVIRGVDVLDDMGRAMRAAGEIVFDSYTESDPVATYMRSQARYAFVPGNVDHTARSTGAFPAESES